MRSRKVPQGAAPFPVPSSAVLWAAGEVRRSVRQLAQSWEAITGGIGTTIIIGAMVLAGFEHPEDRIKYPTDIAADRYWERWHLGHGKSWDFADRRREFLNSVTNEVS